jgi:cellulose synthase (UDP-forming)
MKEPKQTTAKNRFNPPLLGLISIISVVYMLHYLWWRATMTMNPHALVFSWTLWLAEAFGVINYILFAWMTHDISPKAPFYRPKHGVTVDIFVPTYNEDEQILEATLMGCKKITYPHKTYVLDDGNRPDIENLALQLKCNYIARPIHDHAKAGNINYALARTNGEFIVILDADMIPQPDFLDRTLGYFEANAKLAFIQMPQEFYNRDSIQHDQGSPDWHEQALFFKVIQPGKNHSNSAFWCGSPSVVRRKALEDVGGVATETITEDIHTSVRLHSQGWSSLFLDEPLAFGIAPQTVKSFLLQRLRWAQGTMQLYRSKDSPLWIKGLSWQQRFSYLSSFLAYFESFQKLGFLLTPTLIILFNIFPMQIDAALFLLHWVPYFAINVLANQMGGRGFFKYYNTEKYNILKMIIFIESALTLFSGKRLNFKVTPKSVDKSVYDNERRALRLYMGIFGFLTGTIVYGFLRIIVMHGTLLIFEAALVALFWGTYNAMLIFTGVHGVLRKQHDRKHYRFPVHLDGEIYDPNSLASFTRVQLDNLSISGAGLTLLGKSLGNGGGLMLHFDTPDEKCIILPIGKILPERRDPGGQMHIGLSFVKEPSIYRDRLFEYLFIDMSANQALRSRLEMPRRYWPLPQTSESS